jgi:hypothetical protein
MEGRFMEASADSGWDMTENILPYHTRSTKELLHKATRFRRIPA